MIRLCYIDKQVAACIPKHWFAKLNRDSVLYRAVFGEENERSCDPFLLVENTDIHILATKETVDLLVSFLVAMQPHRANLTSSYPSADNAYVVQITQKYYEPTYHI
jgi:hypothetical protein